MGHTVSADLIKDDCICICLLDTLREIPKRAAWREIALLIPPELSVDSPVRIWPCHARMTDLQARPAQTDTSGARKLGNGTDFTGCPHSPGGKSCLKDQDCRVHLRMHFE